MLQVNSTWILVTEHQTIGTIETRTIRTGQEHGVNAERSNRTGQLNSSAGLERGTSRQEAQGEWFSCTARCLRFHKAG